MEPVPGNKRNKYVNKSKPIFEKSERPICKFFATNGQCKLGSKCKFLHSNQSEHLGKIEISEPITSNDPSINIPPKVIVLKSNLDKDPSDSSVQYSSNLSSKLLSLIKGKENPKEITPDYQDLNYINNSQLNLGSENKLGPPPPIAPIANFFSKESDCIPSTIPPIPLLAPIDSLTRSLPKTPNTFFNSSLFSLPNNNIHLNSPPGISSPPGLAFQADKNGIHSLSLHNDETYLSTDGDFSVALSSVISALNIDYDNLNSRSTPFKQAHQIQSNSPRCVTPQPLDNSKLIAADKAKSKALMSLLKSKAGETLNRKINSPSLDFDQTLQDQVKCVDSTIEKDSETKEEKSNAEISNEEKKAFVFRNSRNQCGNLSIKLKGRDNEAINFLRPSVPINVYWSLPANAPVFSKSNSDLIIALFRYGTFQNSPSIFSKNLLLNKTITKQDNLTGQFLVEGFVSFFAPKSAGQFVFRLFDKNNSTETLATSQPFPIVLMDNDIKSNIEYVLDAFEGKDIQSSSSSQILVTLESGLKAVNLFTTVIKGIKYASKDSRDVSLILNSCVDRTFRIIDITLPLIESGDTKRKLERNNKIEEDGNEDELNANIKIQDPEEEEFWKSYRLSCKLHSEINECLFNLSICKTPWYWVSEKFKSMIKQINQLFCPILKRYFRSISDLESSRISYLGFSPASENPSLYSHVALQIIENSLVLLLPELMPGIDFSRKREKAREQLQRSLLTMGLLPPDAKLSLYGSSSNNFGSEKSDLDMCLVFPDDSNPFIDISKSEFIEKIGEALAKIGMTQVSTRSTARIPIVEFTDLLSGLQCDISLHNALAISNTKLLQIYSQIDPRVRSLAYIIKYWAGSRQINSPQDHTLSSYGYILTLIFFLQNRPIPLLPNLQKIPPNWNGEDLNNLPLDCCNNLPKVIEFSSENSPCNTYFLSPNAEQLNALKKFSSRNQESTAQLLIEYFRFYSWSFDYRHQVVSIRQSTGCLEKIEKYETSSWPHSLNLSIEDPFETWYDVAHVIKPAHMSYIRKEFLRAYTLSMKAISSYDLPNYSTEDNLPKDIPPEKFLEILCEPCELPSNLIRKK